MRSDFGLMVARIILGAGIAAHGAQKAFGWFDGSGLDEHAAYLRSLGFPDAENKAKASAANELVSGLLIAAGFLGPVGPSILIAQMAVAIEISHRPKGFFSSDGGYELPLTYAAGALALAASGYGDCSLDTLFGLKGAFRARPWFYGGLLGAGVGAAAVLSHRETSPSPSRDGEQQPVPGSSNGERTAA